MKRVMVIGCPGTGKSILSLELANKTNLPIIHLDKYFHDKNYNFESSPERWRQLVKKLAAQDSWIIDGNNYPTYDIRLPLADTIIFLNFSKYLCLWRILKRRIKYRDRVRPDMAEGWTEKADWELIKYVWNFNKRTPGILKILHGTKNKELLIFNHPREAAHFLQQLS